MNMSDAPVGPHEDLGHKEAGAPVGICPPGGAFVVGIHCACVMVEGELRLCYAHSEES